MVFLTKTINAAKGKSGRTFIDKLRVYVRGGGGGQGLPKSAGQGGRGGDVYVVGDETATLNNLVNKYPKKRFIAEPGQNSSRHAIFAERGSDLDILVPPGIIIRNDAGRVIGEINQPEDRVIVAQGGPGGGPKNSFLGRKCTGISVTLDLKLIADIGLVGFPNAGKSTLLSALSRASPKIANYPFTTIQPQLGTMVYEDERQITVADLPGLIEGAHVNIGMGHSFLKHVERTSLLLFVIDINGFRLSAGHKMRSALENVFLLNKELELYKEELINKPAILVINKIDIDGTENLVQDLVHSLADIEGCLEKLPENCKPDNPIRFDEIIPISAKHRLNTSNLKQRLRHWLDIYADMDFDTDDSRQRKIMNKQMIERRGADLV